MRVRTLLGWLPAVALSACPLGACGGGGDAKDGSGDKTASGATTASGSLTTTGAATVSGDKKDPAADAVEKLAKRCAALGKACGEKDKHQQKVADECKEGAKVQAEKGCTDKVIAAYDCYEKEICEKVKKVWAIDDFRVLSERESKCVDERKAALACIGG